MENGTILFILLVIFVLVFFFLFGSNTVVLLISLIHGGSNFAIMFNLIIINTECGTSAGHVIPPIITLSVPFLEENKAKNKKFTCHGTEKSEITKFFVLMTLSRWKTFIE